MTRSKNPTRPNLSSWSIDEYVPALITWLYNKVASDSSRYYRKRFGVGLADWRILAYLGIHENGTNAEMCEYIGLDKAAVSRSISRLKKLGYLHTHPRNGRDIEVTLTAQGLRLGNRILAAALEIERELMHGIGPQEKKTLLRTLQTMHGNLPRIGAFADRN